jgi:hypothetical protein
MVLTTDTPVPERLLLEIIAAADNVIDGRTVALG